MVTESKPTFNDKGQLYCKKCDQYKEEDDFHIEKARKNRKGRHSSCKICFNKQQKEFRHSFNGENLTRHFSKIISSCKLRSKNDRLKLFSNEITIEFLLELYNKQKGLCALSGIIMTSYINGGNTRFNVSIDRINSLLGYTKDNVQLVCNQVNTMKNNLTDSELYDLCKKIVINLEDKYIYNYEKRSHY